VAARGRQVQLDKVSDDRSNILLPGPGGDNDMDSKAGTRFLNVDLDIFAKVPLDAIVEAFGDDVIVLHAGRRGRRYSAHVELSHSGRESAQQADRVVRQLVRLVDRLPRRARRLWNQADAREFNLGIEAAARSRVFELRLHPATLEAVAKVDGRIVVTVYAPHRVLRVARTRKRRAAGT
jgi:hypothetical protein